MEPILLVLIATIAGTGLRTLYAWLMKYADGQIPIFDSRYIAYALSTTILVLMTSIGFTLAYPIPQDIPNQALLALGVFFGSYTGNDILNDSLNRERTTAQIPSA